MRLKGIRPVSRTLALVFLSLPRGPTCLWPMSQVDEDRGGPFWVCVGTFCGVDVKGVYRETTASLKTGQNPHLSPSDPSKLHVPKMSRLTPPFFSGLGTSNMVFAHTLEAS